MKKLILSLFVACLALTVNAEDGHQLWLRFQPVNKAKVTTPKQTPVINTARQELETYYQGICRHDFGLVLEQILH